MTHEQIAASVASNYCRCENCNGMISNSTKCNKHKHYTCWRYRDGYYIALKALDIIDPSTSKEKINIFKKITLWFKKISSLFMHK